MVVVGTALTLTAQGQPPVYSQATVSADGTQLVVTRSNGTRLPVPRSEGQQGFAKARISSDRRYAGWLEMHSNVGASYPQPIGLTVLDPSNHSHQFGGDFGMVSGWCFGPQRNTLVYACSFPHGATAVGFDMRRVGDGKLLRRFRLDPPQPDENQDELVQKATPSWMRCAWSDARSQ